MKTWYDDGSDDEFVGETPDLTFDVTENPVVAELLGPDGEPLRQWRERPPFGLHPRGFDA